MTLDNSSQHKTILIIEDKKDLADTIADEASFEGFNTVIALNKTEVYEALKSHKIDIIISDIRMPDINGYDLLLDLKKNLKDLPPTIFMSGYSDYTEKKLFSAGAIKVFKKPIQEDLFLFIKTYFKDQSKSA